MRFNLFFDGRTFEGSSKNSFTMEKGIIQYREIKQISIIIKENIK